jgi:hypothetical protein
MSTVLKRGKGGGRGRGLRTPVDEQLLDAAVFCSEADRDILDSATAAHLLEDLDHQFLLRRRVLKSEVD